MLQFLSNIIGGGVSSVIDSAGNIVKIIRGDQSEKDAAVAETDKDTLTEFASEFVARQQRTKWDSFVDGVNRIPRPMLAIGTQATFVWAVWDPVNFTESMKALGTVPDQLWILWLTIVAFYFGGRILETAPKAWKVDPKALDLAKEIAAERTSKQRAETAERKAAAIERTAAVTGVVVQPIRLDPSAEPAVIDNATDHERAVAATIWGEARGEPYEGKIAVGWVIRNRVENPGWWGADYAGVCTAKDQFSCWFDVQGNRVRTVDESDPKFLECLNAAKAVMSGSENDPTGGADHYFADTISTPRWAVGKTPSTKIGHHIFYKIGLSG